MKEGPMQEYRMLPQTEGGDCTVWQFHNSTGDGTMTTYQVFPGVVLSFNDFHMEHVESSYVADRRLLAIDHCREGRMEYSPGDGMLAYTAAGDVKLDLRQQHTGMFVFPSHHYHGLTIAMDRDAAGQALSREFRDFPVEPEQLVARWVLGPYPRVIHGAQELEQLFAQLYRVPEQVRLPYFRVKVLELLLDLAVMPVPEEAPAPYFYKEQVERVKAIQAFLVEHIDESFTQEELSRCFDMPMTTMKTCFRWVYGAAIGTWLISCRMNLAAELLVRRRELGVAEIGCRVGYENAGKFTEAFKRVMGLTPSEYRRKRGRGYES